MQRHCLALDLKPDPAMIAEYEAHHRAVWPEVLDALREAGILNLEIFRAGNRLFMILEAADDFSFERKRQIDQNNTRIQEWEALMWQYQQAIPVAKPGQKWVLMDRIFYLKL